MAGEKNARLSLYLAVSVVAAMVARVLSGPASIFEYYALCGEAPWFQQRTLREPEARYRYLVEKLGRNKYPVVDEHEGGEDKSWDCRNIWKVV